MKTALWVDISTLLKPPIWCGDNPPLTFTVGGDGLVNGDTLSGGLATDAKTASPVGTYDITQRTLAASANYTLTYVGDVLTVKTSSSTGSNPPPLTCVYRKPHPS
jgi:hypothetical protein